MPGPPHRANLRLTRSPGTLREGDLFAVSGSVKNVGDTPLAFTTSGQAGDSDEFQVGARIYAAESIVGQVPIPGARPVLDLRARFPSIVLAVGAAMDFEFGQVLDTLAAGSFVAVIDLVVEERYWLRDRGGSPLFHPFKIVPLSKPAPEPPSAYRVSLKLTDPSTVFSEIDGASMSGTVTNTGDEKLHFEGVDLNPGIDVFAVGARIFEASAPGEVIPDEVPCCEARAHVNVAVLSPGQSAPFHFSPIIQELPKGHYVAVIDLVAEGKFWLRERGGAPLLYAFEMIRPTAEPSSDVSLSGSLPAVDEGGIVRAPGPASPLLTFLERFEPLRGVLAKPRLVEIQISDAGAPSAPLVPHAAPVAILPANPESAVRRISGLMSDLDAVIIRHVLQRAPEYRQLLAAAFDRLAVGGFLIITVPHQYLFERKLQPPSRLRPTNLRFYSPASLMAEIEEAIDPFEYRVRLLADDDRGHDPSTPLHQPPLGAADLVLVIERVARPPWRDSLAGEDMPAFMPDQAVRHPPAGDFAVLPYRRVSPVDGAISSILVLKLDHRGDFVMADEAFRILRHSFPSATITLVCGRWNVAAAESLGLFDRILPFDFFPEDASGVWLNTHDDLKKQFRKLVAGFEFDLAIDLRLYEDTRDLLRLVRTKRRAGFDPYDIFAEWLTIRLAVPVPTRDGRAEIILYPAAKFHCRSGGHLGYEIAYAEPQSLSADTTLLWGPYVRHPPGEYEIEILVEARDSEFTLLFDIAANKGVSVLGVGALAIVPGGKSFPKIQLYCRDPIEDFEIRLFPGGTDPVPPYRFFGVRCTRKGSHIGVHQREAMALLAHLVPLRVRDEYEATLTQ
jgi:hypothetical protein